MRGALRLLWTLLSIVCLAIGLWEGAVNHDYAHGAWWLLLSRVYEKEGLEGARAA